MSGNVYIREIHKDKSLFDMGFGMMLGMFYGLEMAKAMNWTVEQRYFEISKTHSMIKSNYSKALVAENREGMPLGIAIYTKTENKFVRQLDALFVVDKYRRNGIGKKLLEAAKGDIELYTNAIPSSVSWYKYNGFFTDKDQEDGTIGMTTSENETDYKFNISVPLPTEFDAEYIKMLKELEKNIKSGGF